MKKALIAIAAMATIVFATIAAPDTADARHRRGHGAGVAAGVAAGVIGGAIIGGAIANSYPRYAPAPGYVAYGAYGAPPPVGCPGGYWGRRPIAFDAYGNPVRWSRPRYFCP